MLRKFHVTRAAPSRLEQIARTFQTVFQITIMIFVGMLAKTLEIQRPMNRNIVKMFALTLLLITSYCPVLRINSFMVFQSVITKTFRCDSNSLAVLPLGVSPINVKLILVFSNLDKFLIILLIKLANFVSSVVDIICIGIYILLGLLI
jgi:hypothetical protein